MEKLAYIKEGCKKEKLMKEEVYKLIIPNKKLKPNLSTKIPIQLNIYIISVVINKIPIQISI
jgi:hypothetical protein